MGVEYTVAQQSAMSSVSGDLAISAGAGSGKTTVLAHRFANGLTDIKGIGWDSSGVDQILTITFTAKAASEIAERVRRVVAGGATPSLSRRIDEAWISTIHTLCGRLIRRHALEAGVEPDFAQADDVQARLLQAQAFESSVAELYGSDEGVTRALEEFSYPVLRGGVVRLHEQIRSMGLDPATVTFPATMECAIEMARHSARSAVEAADALAEEGMTTARSTAHGVLLDYASTVTSCILDGDLDQQRLAAATAAPSVRKIGSERSKDAIGAHKDANTQLRCALASLEARPTLSGVETLVRTFTSEYARLKQERGALDFDDLQEYAARLFEAHPDVARRYREHFRMIMVDEFQDTNDLQLRVIRHLQNDDLCVVGDERQSIYGFRYADVRIFGRMRDSIRHNVRLQDNFRSHPDLLAFVNGVFSRPELFGAEFMQLRSGRTDGWTVPVADDAPRVSCLLADTADCSVDAGRRSEAAAIAQLALELRDNGTSLGDIAVLLRNKTSVPFYAAAFEALGVPIYIGAGQGFFDAVEVDDVLSLLRTIALPSDDAALIAVLASSLVGLSDDSLFALRRAVGTDGHVYDALRSLSRGDATLDHAPIGDREAAMAAFDAIESLRANQGELGLGALLHRAVEAFDYDLTLFSKGPSGARAWANILKLARFAEGFERVESSDPGAFVEYMKVRNDEGGKESVAATETGGDAVRLMTIHASKGLEFPVVFVADLGVKAYRGAGQFLVGAAESGSARAPVAGVKLPDNDVYQGMATTEHSNLAASQKIDEIEEQKRCLYVACTRARELLFVSGAANLAKEPSDTMLVDWIRGALGDPQACSSVSLPGVTVAVKVILPIAEEESAPPAGGATTERGPIYAARDRSTEEEPEAETIRSPKAVSYSGLHLYDQCPYSYYTRSVLRLREFEAHPELSPAQFGSAVHAVLQSASSDGLARGAVAAATMRYALDEASVGRLERTAASFLNSDLGRRVSSAARVDREQPLRVSVGKSVLVGNVDLIAWEGETALVVDYKTGEPPSPDSDRLPAYRLQASCYALAALRAGAARVEVVFAFVEQEGRTLEFEFAPDERESIEAAVVRRLDAMAAGHYPHLNAFDVAICQRCPALGGLCPIDDPRKRRG